MNIQNIFQFLYNNTCIKIEIYSTYSFYYQILNYPLMFPAYIFDLPPIIGRPIDKGDVSPMFSRKKYSGMYYNNTKPIKNFKNYVGVNDYVPTDRITFRKIVEVVTILSMEINGELIEKAIIFNLHNANERKFKIICSSLKDDDPTYYKIKEFIIYTIGIKQSIDREYDILLQYIYEKKLNNFTIKFENDKQYECNKLVLMTNQYFGSLLSDCDDNTNELHMKTDYKLTKILIKMLYKRKNYNIDPYDFCQVFELADMLLMDNDNIDNLLSYLDANIDTIINYELYKNNINNLNSVLVHLKNIYITDNEFFKCTKSLAYKIYKKIIELDFNIEISNGDSWRLLESLDVKISFMTGIEILKKWDFANDIYAEIENMANLDKTDIYLKTNNCIITHEIVHLNKIIILNEWFPIFRVNTFEKISCNITEINEFNVAGTNECWITLTMNIECLLKIKINSKLLFGFNVSSYPKNNYNVKKIIKCLGENRARVPQALYVSDLEISYKIKLDKCCNLSISTISTQPIWLMKQIEHKVGHIYL